MKIIDLFNDMANNKEIPKKIKISNYIYHFDVDSCQYTRFIDNDNKRPVGLLEDIWLHNAYVWFNLDVEIIENKPEKIEKLNFNKDWKYGLCLTHQYQLVDTLNEVIDKLNYLLEKSDKEC